MPILRKHSETEWITSFDLDSITQLMMLYGIGWILWHNLVAVTL